MSPGDSSVQFQCGSIRLNRKGIRSFAARLQREVAGGRRFECLIARDRELRRLNLEFLGKDYPTDVLSFPSGSKEGTLGDIAISADRAREQAREFGHEMNEEIGILMLHGVLHLLGMDHERDRGRMRRAESKWRKALDLPATLIERAEA
jgi:probable rRNA maturation factor